METMKAMQRRTRARVRELRQIDKMETIELRDLTPRQQQKMRAEVHAEGRQHEAEQRRRAKASVMASSSGASRPSTPKPATSKPIANPGRTAAVAELKKFEAGFKASHGRPASDVGVAAHVLARANGASETAAPAHSHNSLAAQMGLTKHDPSAIVHTACTMTLGATVPLDASPEPRRPAPLPIPQGGHGLPHGEKQALDRKMGLGSGGGAGSPNIKNEETRLSFGVGVSS